MLIYNEESSINHIKAVFPNTTLKNCSTNSTNNLGNICIIIPTYYYFLFVMNTEQKLVEVFLIPLCCGRENFQGDHFAAGEKWQSD